MSGIETSKTNENPREEFRRKLRENLEWLKYQVSLNKEPWITKQPKLENWAAVFWYKSWWHEWEIVTRKENNTYSVRIKKRVKLPNWEMWRQTQKNNNKDTFNFTTDNTLSFNHQLWSALDTIIGTNRTRIPKTSQTVFNLLNSSQTQRNPVENLETNNDKTNIKEKPIDLDYKEKNKEKKVWIEFPQNHYSVEWRVTRCLRWSSITDAVEDRYWIPRWLLMALMAQEWRWDPTVINQSRWWKCDWGAWLIHMQAINAANFWLDTIPRSTNGMVDFKHWERLQKAKEKKHNDLKELSKLDDRFNPILSVDASARFLLNEYNKLPESKDRWLHAINKYAWRWMQDYWYSVVVYRTTINSIRHKPIPQFTKEIEKVKKWQVSAKVNQQRERTDLCIKRTREAINNLHIKLDGNDVSYNDFMIYQRWQCDNYWLSDYIKYNKKHPYKK